MKEKKVSPRKMKQSKLTAFLQKPQNNVGENVKGVKRKIDSVVGDLGPTPPKKISLLDNHSPDLFLSPTIKSVRTGKKSLLSILNENENHVKNDFEEFAFEDFENDPFLSPKKVVSPKKNILGENSSQSSQEDDNWMLEVSELNFEKPVKCRVLKSCFITSGRFEQILQVSEINSEKKGICKLRDSWTFTSFSINDIAVFQTIQSNDGWIIDNKAGYIVLHPDILISSTSMVASMFCMRQGLISNFYKGMDSGSNSKMLIGRLVHELLQECLKNRSCTNKDFVAVISKFFRSPEYLYEFYLSDLDFKDVERELKSFVPQIKNFLDVYVNGLSKPTGKNFRETLEVLDIEEVVKSSNLGFQGRIDVTVKINSKNKGEVAPLELKTGKASFSTEHKSQVILYVLLLNEIGKKVESGLLLYLREGIVEEIVPKRDEIRNLFLLRNKLVSYYKTMKINDLPEPIKFLNACNKCAYLRICTSYLKGLDNGELYKTAPVRSIEIPDVKESHVDYFLKWNKMLWLEFDNTLEDGVNDLEVEDLKLLTEIGKFGEENRYEFSTALKNKEKLMPGTFISLQSNKDDKVYKGKIINVTETSCCISLDKKLENFSSSCKVTVLKSTFLSMYLVNLGLFLEKEYMFLRDIIIDAKNPTFQEKENNACMSEKILKFLLPLNEDQKKAVMTSVLSNDYAIIKGPPGTGKTETIAVLIRVLLALDKTVLIAGHTHASVDNILLRLKDLDYLRLGELKSVRAEIHGKCYKKLSQDCSTVDSVRNLFNRKVIASTCLGLDLGLATKKKYDVCIVDESSQALQPEILRPLFCAKKFILVGDDNQLPPIVRNHEARQLGMSKSMFEVLMNNEAIVNLKLQYRMNSVINSLANAIAYGKMLECANNEVAEATLKITNHKAYLQIEDWKKEILSNELEKSFVFVDTSQYFSWKGLKPFDSSRSSLIEANIVKILVNDLLELGISESDIGIMAPFCNQIALIKRRLAGEKAESIEINTVDQYQGRDKMVVLFSCGKENKVEGEVSDLELLSDLRRLTVALTRAKHKLIFIGDRRTVEKYKPFQALMKHLKESQFVYLTNGKNSFFWEACEN